MRKCYVQRNGELVIREVRTFSATASVVAESGTDQGTRKVFAETNDESLAKWHTRRSFSVTTIDIRLREARKNYRERLKRTVRDYSRYADSKLKAEDLDNFVSMFDNDLLILITAASDDIVKGKTLVSLLGLSSYGSEIKSVGQRFTIAYRKSLKSIDKTGAVTPNIYRQVDDSLNELVDGFHRIVLGSDRYESFVSSTTL